MDLVNQVRIFIENLIGIIFSVYFIIFLLCMILIYHILAYFIKDKKYIGTIKKGKNTKETQISSLTEFPLVNIIIPAWNEGEIFRGCLKCIKNLTYPNLKVLINAGGSEKTIEIAESYKNFENFKILYQKKGEGKIKAINDCLAHISEGLVYLIDADTYLDDEIFLKTIHPLINENNNVIVVRVKPHKSLKSNNLVKYLVINRNIKFRGYISNKIKYVSQNTGLKYEVIKKLKKFSENKLSDDGLAIGSDLMSQGFKIKLLDDQVESFNFPTKIKGYIKQNLRWIENSLFASKRNRKVRILKFIGLVCISFYFFLSFFLAFLNIYLFLFGLFLLLSLYLKRIRKMVFFKKTKENRKISFQFSFFLFMIYFIIVDLLINIIVFLEMIFFRKAYKKRKNLLD
ncbi:MAG: glycosyltransferase [Promethearchaeota archaeon]